MSLASTMRVISESVNKDHLWRELSSMRRTAGMSSNALLSYIQVVNNKPHARWWEITAAELQVAKDATVEHLRDLELAGEPLVELIEEELTTHGS